MVKVWEIVPRDYRLFGSNSLIMAEKQLAIVVVEMHSVSFTVAEHLAILADTLLCPFAMAKDLKAVFPHIPKVILVDVPLLVVVADARACRDASVCQYASHRETCLTTVQMVANPPFIFAQKSLAGILSVDFPFLSCVLYEIEQPYELVIVELKFFMLSRTPYGENGEQTPFAYSIFPKRLTQ